MTLLKVEWSTLGRDAGLRVHTFRGWEGVCVCQSEASCVGWSLEAAPSCVDRAASSKLESACARAGVFFRLDFSSADIPFLYYVRAPACGQQAPPVPHPRLSRRVMAPTKRGAAAAAAAAPPVARVFNEVKQAAVGLGGSGGRAPLAPPRRLRRPPPPNPHPMRTCAGLEIGGAKCVPTRLRRGALLQPWVSLRRPRTRNAALRPRRARPLPPRLWGELPRGACLGGLMRDGTPVSAQEARGACVRGGRGAAWHTRQNEPFEGARSGFSAGQRAVPISGPWRGVYGTR